MKEAFTLLGKKSLTLILHGGSFPSLPDEDVGFGSPNSNGSKKFLQFLKNLGFTGIQLGPSGKTKSIDPSPYTSTSFSNNPLFIDLTMLVHAGLLKAETVRNIVKNNPNPHQNRISYVYIHHEHEKALREAFNAFKSTISLSTNGGEGRVRGLLEEFETYKAENTSWLDKDSLYEALSEIHQNDYWPLWQSELDQRLFHPGNDEEARIARSRIEAVCREKAETIEFYKFCQFLISVQSQELKNFAADLGIKMIADRQIAFSERDYWANQTLFLQDYLLGVPPDYFSKTGQTWGFPVLDPKKLFHPDGSPAEGAIMLKRLFDKLFRENPGGVRIDHIIGLIDPWVYPKGQSAMPEDGAGRLYSSPDHPVLYKYALIATENLDHTLKANDANRVQNLSSSQIDYYGRLLKLLLQSAEEHGLGKEAIICEDLGTLTIPVKAVLKQLGLGGLRVTQFVDPTDPNHPYRGKNVLPRDCIMIGTHDNDTLVHWTKTLQQSHQLATHAASLAEDLLPPNEQQHKTQWTETMVHHPHEFIVAKTAELFASPAEHVMIPFTDLLGMSEAYNKPATVGAHNWTLRVPENFETVYSQNLQSGLGFNLPKVLEIALHAKGYDQAERLNISLAM